MPMILTRNKKIRSRLEGFDLSRKDLKGLMNILDREMNKSLKDSKRSKADVQVLPSYCPLQDKPVTADILELDFTGTQLKVIEVKLRHKSVAVTSEVYTIPPELKEGKGQEEVKMDTAAQLMHFVLGNNEPHNMFEFVADSVKKFVREKDISSKMLKVVVIFPVPGKFLDDMDLNELFQKALETEKAPKIVVRASSTLDTLISAGYQDSKCKTSLSLGHEFNAWYVDEWRRQETDNNKDDEMEEYNQTQVVYFADLGALGEKRSFDFLRTDSDKEVDDSSTIPGSHILEKMVSWTYLGEIVRVVLARLIRDNLLNFTTTTNCSFFVKGGISGELVAGVVREASDTERILSVLGVSQCSQEDVQVVQQLCRLVIQRSAFLAAAGIATLINRLNQPDAVIVLDGELIKNIPDFYNLFYSKTQELVKSQLRDKFYFVSSRTRGYIGAARMAAASVSVSGQSDTYSA